MKIPKFFMFWMVAAMILPVSGHPAAGPGFAALCGRTPFTPACEDPSTPGDTLLAQAVDRGQIMPPRLLGAEEAARQLRDIHRRAPGAATLLCGCALRADGGIDTARCERSPDTENLTAAWIGAMPETVLARARRGGSQRASDLHNLFPEHAHCSVPHGTPEDNIRPGARGDLARAWFYMSLQYGIALDEDLEDRLRMWHLLDPPDAWEEERNTRIEEVQGNRNPFIDQPALVERVPDF